MSYKVGPGKQNQILALVVRQWLDEWKKVNWDPRQRKREADKCFYLFSLPARHLKALSGIQRRTTAGGLARSKDIGIQRRHEKERSDEIARYVRYGYPWSTLSEAKRKSGKYDDLLQPGWLPTAIVVNILKPSDVRRDQTIHKDDVISVTDKNDGTAIIALPRGFSGPGWTPKGLHPIQVIDGQHRLWAFEDRSIDGNFELPVVAFHGLDISWEAYLFWTINIKPKKINASLAYDMYPLLRTQEWLERSEEGYFIYRETRAQELVETLWSNRQSPWHEYINMLGEPGMKKNMVSQAAWIRSLMATYVKSRGPRLPIGGLFGAPVGKEVLPWSRPQQAAFLIFVGEKIKDAIEKCRESWALALRAKVTSKKDPAFYGDSTLINTDQGVRAILHVTNDLCYIRADDLQLQHFTRDAEKGLPSDGDSVDDALRIFRKDERLRTFLEETAKSLATYDWRTASAPGLDEDMKTAKLVFRGSGGYRELRRQLLKHLAKRRGSIGEAADKMTALLGYD
jgi:DGQHR domain-containing protein